MTISTENPLRRSPGYPNDVMGSLPYSCSSIRVPLWFHNQTYAYVLYIQITHMSYVYIYMDIFMDKSHVSLKKYHISKTTHIQKNVYFRYMFNLRTTCHGMLTKKKSWLFDPWLTTTFLCILETNNLPFTAAIPQSAAHQGETPPDKKRFTRHIGECCNRYGRMISSNRFKYNKSNIFKLCHANINVYRSLLEPGGFSIFGDVSPLFLGQLLVDVMPWTFARYNGSKNSTCWDLIVFPESQALPKIPNQGIPPNPKTENLHLNDFIRLGVRVVESLPMLEERLAWLENMTWIVESGSQLQNSEVACEVAFFWSVGETLRSFFVQPQEKRQTLFYLEASVWGLLES